MVSLSNRTNLLKIGDTSSPNEKRIIGVTRVALQNHLNKNCIPLIIKVSRVLIDLLNQGNSTLKEDIYKAIQRSASYKFDSKYVYNLINGSNEVNQLLKDRIKKTITDDDINLYNIKFEPLIPSLHEAAYGMRSKNIDNL